MTFRVSFFLFLILLFSSCDGNQIHFDLKSQTINSSNSKSIRVLVIENVGFHKRYRLEWKNKLIKPLQSIYVHKIDTNYRMTYGYKDSLIENNDFKLLPNSKYRISRSGGDASSYRIIIKTNSKGKVY